MLSQMHLGHQSPHALKCYSHCCCVPESLTCNLANQESGLLAMLLCIRASTVSYRCKHASDIGKVLCILLLNLYKALIFMLFSLIKG